MNYGFSTNEKAGRVSFRPAQILQAARELSKSATTARSAVLAVQNGFNGLSPVQYRAQAVRHQPHPKSLRLWTQVIGRRPKTKQH
jgi:hypothetical protein